MNAIENGKKDIRSEADFDTIKMSNGNGRNGESKALMTEANLKSTYEKSEKFSDNSNGVNKTLLPVKIVNDILKGDENVAIRVDDKEPDNTTALLCEEGEQLSPERYPTSEFHQFWVVLKRTLLFSRRDWVRFFNVEFS